MKRSIFHFSAILLLTSSALGTFAHGYCGCEPSKAMSPTCAARETVNAKASRFGPRTRTAAMSFCWHMLQITLVPESRCQMLSSRGASGYQRCAA